jgi:hypothetical protein
MYQVLKYNEKDGRSSVAEAYKLCCTGSVINNGEREGMIVRYHRKLGQWGRRVDGCKITIKRLGH